MSTGTTTVDAAALLHLMALASPALPVGGFSYSEDLEAAVEAGLVRHEAQASDWLLAHLQLVLARAELPALAQACTAALTVQGVMPRDADFKQTLCADSNGFSLHAAVRCGADDRQALEQLCRYITRPPCRPRRARGPAPRQAQTVHRTVSVRARHWPTSAYKPTPLARSC